MPLLRKKDPHSIPPVASATYVTRKNPYNALPMNRSSSHVDKYTEGEDQYTTDRYPHSRGVPDTYARGEADIEQDRNALLSGYKPQKSTGGSGRFPSGPDIGHSTAGEETEEDIEGIKQQTQFIKQESVKTTRNAIRMAREAEETAMNTLGRLGDQSEKLANTERHMDVAKGHSARAEDKTDELKKLNRSIFRPAIIWNKDEKRRAQEAKTHARFEEERNERERAMLDIRDSHNRVGKAVTYGRNDEEEAIGGQRQMLTATQQKDRMEQRKRFQFEETPSDNELEDELDDNLNEISNITKRLQTLGTAMGQELDQQNSRIGRISQKTDRLDGHIFRNTEKADQIDHFVLLCNMDRILQIPYIPDQMVSDYEKQKAASIARNKELLRSLGLDQPLNEPKVSSKKGTFKRKYASETESVDAPTPKIQRITVQTDEPTALRRSSRNSGKKVDYSGSQSTGLPQLLIHNRKSENEGPMGREAGQRIHNPKTYGHIPGVAVGTWWLTREACSRDAIHAPWVGGISGGPEGAYSVVLSGGYDDDVDMGYSFTYTGSGGRDLKGTKTAPKNLRTAPQSSDQTFENNFNKMLLRSSQTRRPVRVVRGFKVRSKYAPAEGYRYDGLYRVEQAWLEKGLEGYLVCKYIFRRLGGQPVLSVNSDYDEEEAEFIATEDA